MIRLPHVEHYGAGWWGWKHTRIPVVNGQLVHFDGACITCGGCGRPMSLSGHKIAADGTVSPSVVCPRKLCPGTVCPTLDCDHPPCTWHVHVQLVGWSGVTS